MTGASLGVTGVIAGGAYLSSGLNGQGDTRVLNNPQNLAALGARAVDIDDRRSDDRADRSERGDESSGQSDQATGTAGSAESGSGPASEATGSDGTASASGARSVEAGTDGLAVSTAEGVINRVPIEERRQAEREQERQDMLESADPRVIAQALLSEQGYGSEQFSCLDSLWTKESGWDPQAQNPSSGAYGIPQALPGSKMATFGDDWQWNPKTQIEWGLWYIEDRYGTPCGAWAHSQSVGWY